MTIFRRSAVLVASAAASALIMTGCSSLDGSSDAVLESESIAVSDQWVKAADSGITAAFAELQNNSDRDITVVTASSTVSDAVELHEIVEGGDGGNVMREKEGGFVVPAGQTHSLAPGGDHLMLMGLAESVGPGSDVAITLTFADGSTVMFDAQAREFSGNNENYEGEMDHTEHSEMDHTSD